MVKVILFLGLERMCSLHSVVCDYVPMLVWWFDDMGFVVVDSTMEGVCA